MLQLEKEKLELELLLKQQHQQTGQQYHQRQEPADASAHQDVSPHYQGSRYPNAGASTTSRSLSSATTIKEPSVTFGPGAAQDAEGESIFALGRGHAVGNNTVEYSADGAVLRAPSGPSLSAQAIQLQRRREARMSAGPLSHPTGPSSSSKPGNRRSSLSSASTSSLPHTHHKVRLYLWWFSSSLGSCLLMPFLVSIPFHPG